MLYKNCRELPMHNFNEIEITSDVKYLIKDDSEHEQAELDRHWIEILEEYFQLTNDHSKLKFFRDRLTLRYLETKLMVLERFQSLIEDELLEDKDPRIQEICKECEVKEINQGILEISDKINLLISRLNKESFKQKNSNFDEMLATMRINGYNVDRYSVTVAEWVALLDQNKKQKAVLNGRGRKK